MKKKRLNGLEMLAIHNDVKFSSEEFIGELAKKPIDLDIIYSKIKKMINLLNYFFFVHFYT